MRMSLKQNYPPSLLILVSINIITIFGIIFLNWKTPEIIIAFWAESAIIGFFVILKMIKTKSIAPEKVKNVFPVKIKYLLVPFFIFHYGIFMLAHLAFIFVMFNIGETEIVLAEIIPTVAIIFASLFISHLFSYRSNFIENKEYEKSSVIKIMFSPYKRILTMHFAIILGFIIYIFLIPISGGSPIEKISAIILTIIKILADSFSHLKESKLMPFGQLR